MHTLINKLNLIIFIEFFIVSSLFAQSDNIVTVLWNGEYVECAEGQILVGLASGVIPTDISNLLKQLDLTIIEDFDRLKIGLLEISDKGDLLETINTLNREESIRYAEPNIVIYSAQTYPNDPYFQGTSPATYRHQYGLYNIGQNPPGGTSDADIDAPEAWDHETGSPDILIAVLDSGIPLQGFPDFELSHPDLNDPNRFLLGPDYVGDGNDVKDQFGHGTHVTGIIAAETNNSEGIAGVNWDCRTLTIQILDRYGNGYWSYFKNGIYYAVDHNANIINFSGGGSIYSATADTAVQYAHDHGVFQSYSAGNEGSAGVRYPARFAFESHITGYENGYSSVVSVGATQYDDERAWYSSYDPNNILISIAAPGGSYDNPSVDPGDIFSTMPNYHVYLNGWPWYSDQNYGYLSGTSMSAPFVSGLAGLILSRYYNYTPSEIRNILEYSADDVNSTTYPGEDIYLGHGRINANQAILYADSKLNKSEDYTATYSNSARNQVKGAGYLHEVFSSGGEILYRRSSDGGEHFNVTERITTGNGNNQRACIACYNWTPSEIEFTTLAVVWERKLSNVESEVWYSSSDAQTLNWSTPLKLADIVLSSSYESGALPVISSLEYQGDIQLVVVYCSEEGLHYRLYFPSSSTWAIPEPDIIESSDRVRFPSLSSGNSFLSLLYEIRGRDGVFSRKYNGASWSSSYHVADVTGTWYNRSPSITIDPENHPLAAWRGQISYDPCYSLLFRYGYSNNTWSEWYAIFEHPDEISLYNPSITYYKKTGISTYGIKIVYDNSINEIRLKEYDIGNLWDDILVTTGGKYPNMTEEDYTSGNPVYCWTDQVGPPYTVINNTYCGLPCHGGNKVLAGLEKGQTSIQHPRTSFIHKRRGVILDTLTGSSLILDVEPIVVQTSDGKEIILPFKPIAVHQPINFISSNYNGYLGNDTLTLPTNAANLVFKSHLSTPSGTDSSGITHNNLFAGNYSASLQVINVLNPAASISTNITSNSIVNVNLQSLAGRQVIIKPMVSINNLFASRLKFGVGDVYSPVQSAPKENLIGFESATIIPNRIRLENNYPNPFNPITTIRFSLPENQQVKLTVYTITGERIATLVSGFLESGEHRIEWNGTNQAGTPVASGIYLYELKAGNERLVKKMLLAR